MNTKQRSDIRAMLEETYKREERLVQAWNDFWLIAVGAIVVCILIFSKWS